MGSGHPARGVQALTTIHSTAQQARQVLADRLRELRVHAGLTGQAHAALCEWNPAKTSRIENNKTTPSAEDIRTWCRACAADDKADDLVASLRAVEGMFLGWRRLVRDGQRHIGHALLPLYERTSRFRSYSSWFIPGVIQTAAYTEQVLRAVQSRLGIVDDVGQALEARAARRELLTNGSRVFAFLIEEHVLRAGVVDHTIMDEQLRHLNETAALPNVSLGIVPTRLGRERGPVESFWIFDNAQVNVELVSGFLTVTQPSEVAVYADTFAQLASLAVYGSEARTRIESAMESLA